MKALSTAVLRGALLWTITCSASVYAQESDLTTIDRLLPQDWRFNASHTLLTYGTQQAPEQTGPYNTDNALAAIPSRLLNAEWRENWRLRASACDVSADWRLTAEKTLHTDNHPEASSETDFYLRTGSVGCRLGGSFEVRVGRDVIQWGNGTFRSPSNPLFIDTGKTHPIRELYGKDILQVDWQSESEWSLSALRHFGNAHRDTTVTTPFHGTTVLRANRIGQESSFGTLVSRRDDGLWRVGGYQTSTISDALLLYSDVNVQRGSDGLRPKYAPDSLIGWRFARPAGAARRMIGSVLFGGAYTFESGWTLTNEWLFNNEGYNKRERLQAAQAARAADTVWRSSAPYAGSGAAVLGDALNPNLSQLNRRYTFLQLQRSDIYQRGDVALRMAYGLDDGSRSLSSFVGWGLNDRTQLVWYLTVNRGATGAEFSRLMNYSTLLGLRITL